MKLIIAGSRDITDESLVHRLIHHLLTADASNSDEPKPYGVSEVVCGDAKGIDTLGAKWAEWQQIPVNHFPADWDTYGKSAGPIRNEQMADYADALLLIWDGSSSGSADMLTKMVKKRKPVYVYTVGA